MRGTGALYVASLERGTPLSLIMETMAIHVFEANKDNEPKEEKCTNIIITEPQLQNNHLEIFRLIPGWVTKRMRPPILWNASKQKVIKSWIQPYQ